MAPRKSLSPYDRSCYAGQEIPVFCQKVQTRRLELGLKQEELAKLIGTDRPRISELEAGRFPRDEKRIIALAAALNCSLNWLFGLSDEI